VTSCEDGTAPVQCQVCQGCRAASSRRALVPAYSQPSGSLPSAEVRLELAARWNISALTLYTMLTDSFQQERQLSLTSAGAVDVWGKSSLGNQNLNCFYPIPLQRCITVCAVAQHCRKGDERFKWEMPFSGSSSSGTHEPISKNFISYKRTLPRDYTTLFGVQLVAMWQLSPPRPHLVPTASKELDRRI